MKTMNRLALIVVSLAIFNIAAVVQADDYTYITNNGTITITGYTGPGGNVSIPSTIDALPVTAIEEGAFGVRTNLTAVTIPDSVIEIGDYAFSQCVVLTNVVMGGSVGSIGDHAFTGCHSLSAMLLPQSLTNFGIAVFSGCPRLSAIEIAPANSFYSSCDGVLFDKSQALLVEYPSGKGLSYAIPQGVKAIGDYAFFEGSLTNLAIADSVTNVGSSAFAYCTGLSCVQFGNGIRTIDDAGFYLCRISSLVIPDSVTSIGNSAFVQYFSLTNLVIGNSVTNIGDGAFGSSSFTNVTIPGSVVHLGYAFDLCTLLTAINVAPLNPSYSSVDGVLFNRDQTVLLFHRKIPSRQLFYRFQLVIVPRLLEF